MSFSYRLFYSSSLLAGLFCLDANFRDYSPLGLTSLDNTAQHFGRLFTSSMSSWHRSISELQAKYRSYEGHSLCDHKEGSPRKTGTLELADGSKYTGELVNGLMDGKGILVWTDGSVYEGEFKEGLIHGLGACKWANGYRYDDIWERGWPGDFRQNKDLLDPDSPGELLRVQLQKYPSTQPLYRAVIFQSTFDPNAAFQLQSDAPLKLLSQALPIGGYRTELITFDSSKDLSVKAQSIKGDIDLIWFRVHGSGPSLICGENDPAGLEELSPLFPSLSKRCTIIFQSCRTGGAHMLGEKVLSDLCLSGKDPVIIAPEKDALHIGLDLQELTQGRLNIPMIYANGYVQNVSRTLNCPEKSF